MWLTVSVNNDVFVDDLLDDVKAAVDSDVCADVVDDAVVVVFAVICWFIGKNAFLRGDFGLFGIRLTGDIGGDCIVGDFGRMLLYLLRLLIIELSCF